MFRNYLVVAWRNLIRNKAYSFINILGLALGIACCILIFLFVQDEWEYDAFHQNADRIFRVIVQKTAPEGSISFSTLTPSSLPVALKEEVPGIVGASGFICSDALISYQGQGFQERVGLVHPDFLRMFTFPLLAGDPTTALEHTDGVVITETVARKFFGSVPFADVIGKSLSSYGDNHQDFIITGVMESVPQTSSIQFDLLIPIDHRSQYSLNNDWVGEASAYIQLAEGQASEAIEEVLPAFAEKQVGDRIKNLQTYSLVRNSRDAFLLRLQPFREVYLNPQVESAYEKGSDPFYSYMLSGIALVVLVIASINFTILSVGQSAGRAKEVGMRKALGAQRGQLMKQFWGEAFLTSFLALSLGVALTELFLPTFNMLAQKHLPFSYFGQLGVLLALVGIMGGAGLVSGSYPAVVISRFQPIEVLRGRMHFGGQNAMTYALVVVQYVLSIALMISAAVMVRQVTYLHTKELGFNKEHVIVVSGPNYSSASVVQFKERIVKYPMTISATTSDRSFTNGWNTKAVKQDNGEVIDIRNIRIDSDYLKTLDIHLIAGRNFPQGVASEAQHSVVVNEKLVNALGWKDPVGRVIKGLDLGGSKDPTVIGVVNDFHIDPLNREIQPLVLHMASWSGPPTALVRVRSDDIAKALVALKEEWESIAPEQPFQYSFLDENLANQYQNEERWTKIVGYAFVVAIFISCLGLLGLTSLTVTRRTKEIGIRKVLGASIPSIVVLLSKEFTFLVLAANLIAWPIAWYAMHSWLESFAYRIELGPGVFVLGGVLALGIAWLTVSYQAIRAARANPVEALRYE